jgi:very-short-patch-repair endonuclease
MSNEAQLRDIQGCQLGLITREQVADLGLSRKVIAQRVRVGAWARVHPGVYRDTLVVPSLPQSSLAALLWAGPDAFVSFVAAGALWALDGLGADQVSIWTPRRLRSDVVVVHRGTVAVNDRRMLGPIRLTSPARTLVDLAGGLDDEDLTAAVENAIHRGLTTPMSIGRCLDAVGGKGRPGTARLREILDDRGNQRAAVRRLEVKIWRTLRAKGLNPVRQYPARCGNTTYWLDFAFPQWRVGVEGFGDRFHRAARNRKRELKRLADLAQIRWRVVPVTWEEITDAPDDVVANIVTTLAA